MKKATTKVAEELTKLLGIEILSKSNGKGYFAFLETGLQQLNIVEQDECFTVTCDTSIKGSPFCNLRLTFNCAKEFGELKKAVDHLLQCRKELNNLSP